jgi:Las1-like protein
MPTTALQTSLSKGCVSLHVRIQCSVLRKEKKLSAWRFMMPLPHALESLLSILVAVRQDNTSDICLSSSLSLRQSYATALVRLVNGLVDPLQSGTYARSILSIAAQIGLPAWLVELRHAATHEDLPSLELLRDGAKEVSEPSSRPSHPRKKKDLRSLSSVSHLAIAQLLSPHAESFTNASALALDSPRRTAAKTVQEPIEDRLARRVIACAPHCRYLRRAARDRAMDR